MAYYALLGGRSIDHLRDFTLETKIFSYLNIHPNQILLIPLATYPNMNDAISKFQCLVPKDYKVQSLTSFSDLKEIEAAIKASDVIYFSGGSSENLVRFVKEFQIDELLKEYKNTNKLFIGISAGAILFSHAGMGDQYVYKDKGHLYNYKMVKGLGILPITICPHYDHDGLECYNEEVKNFFFDGYALEDDTALLLLDNPIIFKQDNQKSVYQFEFKKNYTMRPLYEVKQ